MSKTLLLNEILAVLQTVKEDRAALEKIHTFLMNEIWKEPEPEKIPAKYKKTITVITDHLMSGFVCFLNPDTLEVEDVPTTMLHNPEEYELLTGESAESIELKHEQWETYIEIGPMDTHESFSIMKSFIDKVPDKHLQQKLINALNKRRPFANFKALIENSNYRTDWFNYRKTWYEDYVWQQIKEELHD